jgi:hypothetical protein
MKKRIDLLILMLISITMSGIAHAGTVITDGLVSYWSFDLNNIEDGIIEDVWGENDATIKRNPKVTGGLLRQGLEFDGAGDYVVLENLGNFQTRTAPSTIELWVKTSDTSTYRTLFRVLESPCSIEDQGWGLSINASWKSPNFQGPGPPNLIPQQQKNIFFQEGYLLFENNRNGVVGKTGKRSRCHTLSAAFRHTISDGKWHHIVFVTDALYIDEKDTEWKTSNLYIDNIHLPIPPFLPMPWGRFRGNALDDLIPYTQPVYLGATNNKGKAEAYFRGVIDEVRVYNRAITHEEVTHNFVSRLGLAVEPAHKLSVAWGELKTKR